MSLTRADFVVGLVSFGVMLIAAPGLLVWGGGLYDRANPVVTDWTPQVVMREGDDLIVAGTMARRRGGCMHIAPPMARIEVTGQNVPVVSTSPTAGMSWAASVKSQRFGPWRVVGGAKADVTFYLHHRCHSMWDTTTELGTVNAPKGTP